MGAEQDDAAVLPQMLLGIRNKRMMKEWLHSESKRLPPQLSLLALSGHLLVGLQPTAQKLARQESKGFLDDSKFVTKLYHEKIKRLN